METVDTLTERAAHLSLCQTQSLDKLDPSIDSYLQKIFDSLNTSTPRGSFIKTVQHESQGQATVDPLASLDDLRAYMKSAASSAQAPATELDLSAPISDYYISSSHNTYLTGNQLSSDADASAYTSVRYSWEVH